MVIKEVGGKPVARPGRHVGLMVPFRMAGPSSKKKEIKDCVSLGTASPTGNGGFERKTFGLAAVSEGFQDGDQV